MLRQAILILTSLVALMTGPARATPQVVVSVLPLQALVAEVTKGRTEPYLLIPPGISPHDYSLKPSDARALRQADLVIRVGSALEPGLDRALTGHDQGRVITLLDDPRLIRRPLRRSDRQITDLPANSPGGGYDAHLWLDPDNAITILRLTAAALAEIDPAGAALYRRNAARASDRLSRLKTEIGQRLASVRTQPYLSFHDAYHYLEARYGLNNRGFVLASSEHAMPGARHIRLLRDIVRRDRVRCLFTEPEYEPRLITPVIEGLPVRVAMLDHLGIASLGKSDAQDLALYERMMRKLADDLASCLSRPAPSS